MFVLRKTGAGSGARQAPFAAYLAHPRDEVVELHHVDVADHDLLVEGFAGAPVEEGGLAILTDQLRLRVLTADEILSAAESEEPVILRGWGVRDFLVGDALKILAAAGLLPLTWRLLGRGSGKTYRV